MDGTLYTIGYERALIGDLLGILTGASIAVVADVRAIAHSRHPDFAKTALARHLAVAGIEYWHLPQLGNPKLGREAAWMGNQTLFEAIFRAHLATPRAAEALDSLAARSARQRVCLLCLEAEPERCHRSFVAAELAARSGLAARHLIVAQPDARST